MREPRTRTRENSDKDDQERGLQSNGDLFIKLFSFLNWRDQIKLKSLNIFFNSHFGSHIMTKTILEQTEEIIKSRTTDSEIIEYIKNIEPGSGQKVTCLMYAKLENIKALRITGSYVNHEKERWEKVKEIVGYSGTLVFEKGKSQNTFVNTGNNSIKLKWAIKDKKEFRIGICMKMPRNNESVYSLTLCDFEALGYRIPKHNKILVIGIDNWTKEKIILLVTRLKTYYGYCDIGDNKDKKEIIQITYTTTRNNLPNEYHVQLRNLIYNDESQSGNYSRLISQFELSWDKEIFMKHIGSERWT